MCGIVGFFASQGPGLSEDVLQRMNSTLLHRGPDQDGVFLDGAAGLAMRRLSIIGLGNGRQPIFNEDRTVAIVMNGEIYNYRELRERLLAAGHTFATGSDVEVAVHLYEEVGSRFVEELRGMFAYALFDRRRNLLFLGRDRVGKKPLYVARLGHLLLFASEVKALLASGVIEKDVDRRSLAAYLAHGFVPGERTLFAGITKLPPGCTLTATSSGDVTVESYWDFPITPSNGEIGSTPSFDEAAARVRSLLEDAVRVRLMSEVPLGAFLSGGVDSSAVVAIMSRESTGPVETFAVGFDDPNLDEIQYARTAATLYRTRHHEVRVSDCTPELLQQMNWFHDEPAADPASVPTLHLARFARQHVTVALTGEGGDELFAGYRHHRMHRTLLALEDRGVPAQAAARILSHFEPSFRRFGSRRLWKGVWVGALPREQRPRGLLALFTDLDIARLLRRELRDDYALEHFARLQAHAGAIDSVGQSLYVDAKSQLVDQLLMKVDKMTMAASLEARCPFLDHPLIDFVGPLPTAMKISAAGSKLLLRHALRGLVPDALLDRPKQGFEVPIRRWLLGGLVPFVDDMLGARSPLEEYLNLDVVREMRARLASRADSHLARQLWALLNLAVWHEIHWPRASSMAA